ncbi:MAG: hypothetical protein AB8C13_04140 [Phycisphaerales bacterium]
MSTIVLENSTIRVVIDPTDGCQLNTLELRSPAGIWTRVLGSPADQIPGSFLMLPWTNRIQDARFEFEGGDHQLTSNHSDGTAIHGTGRDHQWQILDRSPYSARMSFDSRTMEKTNWPYPFGAVLRIEIHEQGHDTQIEIELDVENLGDRSMPCGIGHHPYFMRSLWNNDDELSVRADVQGRYPCDAQIPVDDMKNDDVCDSLRKGAPIGNPDLDDVFGGFSGDAKLSWDASGVTCTMSCSDAFGHLVIYTPRESTAHDQQTAPPLGWVCVEPVTMVNDGFNRMKQGHSDTGVRVLAPGEALRTTMTLSFTGLKQGV